MPIVHVRASVPADASAVKQLVEALPHEVEIAAGVREGGVWCTYTALSMQSVGGAIHGPGHHGAAYLEVLLRPRDAEQTALMLRSASEVTARMLGLEVEDVWARAVPLTSGEVFAGGELQRW